MMNTLTRLSCLLVIIGFMACKQLDGIYISKPNYVATSYQFLPKRKVLVCTSFDYGYETVNYADYKIKKNSIFLNFVEVPEKFKLEETSYSIDQFESSVQDSVHIKINYTYINPTKKIKSIEYGVFNNDKNKIVGSYYGYGDTIPAFKISKADFPIRIYTNVDFTDHVNIELQQKGNYTLSIRFATDDIRYNTLKGGQLSYPYYEQGGQSFIKAGRLIYSKKIKD